MAEGNNPFSGYNDNISDGRVRDITSSMWEPISAGPSLQKDTPVRKNEDQTKKTASAGTKSATSQKKAQGKKSSGIDVTRDRISKGGNNEQRSASSKKKSVPSGDAPKKKKTSSGNKKPVGGKSREPKGRDTRNPDVRAEKARLEREKKRAREHARTKKKADEKSRQGVSYDEMRKKKSDAAKRKKRFLGFVVAFFCFVALACGVGIYAYQNGAVVQKIVIEGESRYKDKKITEAANIFVGINMLSVREKATNEAVTKSLPYIKDVKVDYRFPETLALVVTSAREKLLLAGKTGYICLDGDGKVLSLKKKKLTDGRYLVEGLQEQTAEAGEAFVPSEENKAKYEKAVEIASLLESSGKFPKGTINVSNLQDVTVVYDSRVNIYLGDCQKLESQIESAVNIIAVDEDIKNGQTGYIDTRFDGQTPFKPGSMKK